MINNGYVNVMPYNGALDGFTVEQEIDGMLLYEYLLKSYQSDSSKGTFFSFSKILTVGPGRVRNTYSLTKACEYLEFRGHIRFLKDNTPKTIELLYCFKILGNTSQKLRKRTKKKVVSKRPADIVNPNVNMPIMNYPIYQNKQWNNYQNVGQNLYRGEI